MLEFQPQSTPCRYRVVGVALHDNHVLMQQDGNRWILPGQHVPAEQSVRDVLKQHISRTLGDNVHVEKLLWIDEHIVDQRYGMTYDLTFYFQVSFPPALQCFPRNTPITWIDQGRPMTYRWIPLAALDELHIAYQDLQQKLANVMTNHERIVYNADQMPALLEREACA